MNKEKCSLYWSDFHKALSEVGINKGDVVYVSSDIARIFIDAKKELEISGPDDRNCFIDELIDELKEHVGELGTLLFPVYSWDFCRGKSFDIKKTQGEVGVLNNYILNNRNDFERTKHPIYSLMVWGKDAKYLCGLNNQEAWGKGSPFEYMHKVGAKELLLNAALLRGFTFKHFVEQEAEVPYRYPKYFLADYIDADGVCETRCYSMYVRDLSVELESCQEIDFFIERGAACKTLFHGWSILSVDLAQAYPIIFDNLKNDGGSCIYNFTGYKIDWNNKRDIYEVGFLKTKKCISKVENNDL